MLGRSDGSELGLHYNNNNANNNNAFDKKKKKNGEAQSSYAQKKKSIGEKKIHTNDFFNMLTAKRFISSFRLGQNYNVGFKIIFKETIATLCLH